MKLPLFSIGIGLRSFLFMAVCSRMLPPGHPADTAHSFILFRRDGIAVVEVLGQAVHIHEPPVTCYDVPDLSCPAERSDIGRR